MNKLALRIQRIFRRGIAYQLRSEILPTSSVEEINGLAGLEDFLDSRSYVPIPCEYLGSPDQVPRRIETEKPDYIVNTFSLEKAPDVQVALSKVVAMGSENSRFVFVSYNRFYLPVIWFLEFLGLKQKQTFSNYLSRNLTKSLIELSGLEIVRTRNLILLPLAPTNLFTNFINGVIANLPFIRGLAFCRLVVAKQRPVAPVARPEGVSILVPARNEAGHLNDLVDRLPQLSESQEVVFIEGGSSDNTWDSIREVSQRLIERGFSVSAFQQQGKGKGDAVRLGIREATHDTIIILDADLSVPPEELQKFVQPYLRGVCDFALGTRLVYGMESGAMRLLNLAGNRLFAGLVGIFSGYPISDALCGTKIFSRADYARFSKINKSVSKLDPFGDFELIFMAARLGSSVREIPVHYMARTYGATNISRFRDGFRLFQVLWHEYSNLYSKN